MDTTQTIVMTEPEKLGTVIDENSYQTLLYMLNSKDKGDHLLAREILNQCDVKRSIYWIWKLAKNAGTSNMVYARTKASRAFRDACDIYKIAYLNEERFAGHLKSKQWMTSRIFLKLRKGILKQIKDRSRNDFFDVLVTLNEKTRQLQNSDEIISLKNDDYA